MKICNGCILFLIFHQICEYISSPVKDVKPYPRLLAAILGYRKEDLGFISDVVRAHNKFRRIHGCPDVSQCARLRQQAGMYAQTLANQGGQEPRKDPKLEFGIGENIYISCGNDVSGEEVVNHWYNEVCNFFGNKKSYNEYKHFAQIVWKSTYLIGVGRRTTTRSGQKCTYVVTRYRPAAEQGPAESVNVPKGNFDSSICSSNVAASNGVTPTGTQASTGGNTQSLETGGQTMTNAAETIQGRTAGENFQPMGASNAPTQPESGQTVGQNPGYIPAESMGSETSSEGSVGNGGILGGNAIPNVKPTSIPGTGDRERATNPENSHISPLIEQPETGGSSQDNEDQEVSPAPAPHCPPCPNNEIQTERFETSGGAENLPESGNKERSTDKENQSSTNSNPIQPETSNEVNSANPDNSQPDNEQVNQGNSAEPDKPAEGEGRPAQQGSSKVSEQENNPSEPESSKPDSDKQTQSNEGTSSGGQVCSCPDKQDSKRPKGTQSSQESQTQTGGKAGEQVSGNEISQGKASGNEVSQGQASGNEVSQGQSNEGSQESQGQTGGNTEKQVGGNKVSQGQPSDKEVPQGQSNEGSNTPTDGQGGQVDSEGKPVSPSGSENNSGSESSGGNGGSQGATSSGSEGSEGVVKPETNENEGSREGQGETAGNNEGNRQAGQTGATQGTSGQESGTSGHTPEGGAFIESLNDFQQSALDAHNKFRKFHNSPSLTLNSEMSTQATEFAKTLTKSGINDIEHSLKSSRENQGENLYAACGTNPSGADVTKEWYKELCNYDYNKIGEIDKEKPVGHFTQVVWKSSLEFGIGRAYGSKNEEDCVYIVARYRPPGNIQGSEAANVLRGTMDSEYCGREFAALNKPTENGTKQGLSNQPSDSEVNSEPDQNTNKGSQQESSDVGSNKGQNTGTTNGKGNPKEGSNVEMEQNNRNSKTDEVQTTNTASQGINEQNTNNGASETQSPENTRNSGDGGRFESSTTDKNGQTSLSPERDGNKRIRTPFLPNYLQNSVIENTNKRFKGLRTE